MSRPKKDLPSGNILTPFVHEIMDLLNITKKDIYMTEIEVDGITDKHFATLQEVKPDGSNVYKESTGLLNILGAENRATKKDYKQLIEVFNKLEGTANLDAYNKGLFDIAMKKLKLWVDEKYSGGTMGSYYPFNTELVIAYLENDMMKMPILPEFLKGKRRTIAPIAITHYDFDAIVRLRITPMMKTYMNVWHLQKMIGM